MIEAKTASFWKATTALGAASFLIFANLYYPQPLLPMLSEEFQVSEVASSLIISIPLIVLGITFFVYSALSDAFGRRNILFISMILGIAGTILISMAPSFGWLMAARVFQAAALAGIPVAAMAYLSEEYSKKAMTVAVGIYISANSFGGMSGRVASGIIADASDWQLAFIIMAGVSVGIGIFVWFMLPESTQFTAKPFHFKTTLQNNWMHLKDKKMALAYIIGGLHFFVFIGVFNFITYLLNGEPFFVSATILGLLFLTYGAGTFSSTLAGKMAQVWNQTSCMLIGIALMAIGIVLTSVPSFPVILIALLTLSFGFFFVHSSSSSWVTRHAVQAKASASGLYLTSYYLGGGLSSVYFGWLWPSFGWPGVVTGAAAVLIITLSCTLSLRRIDRAEQKAASSVFVTN
ncbi:YNFM family putative membrane transporter [Sinobaca qinghaiensis]|uniref:YNFM family putative membrane transporter n=1 Tax=Sinobaca qinghaiensis TaxID=342944 RepID=A0A419V6E9_9BACL|nr:MFS transporter [Sinobaca qinghaiensis]RKD75540.1 YNFM family putative membrane transporter [Sinobaca qinghaiensis]